MGEKEKIKTTEYSLHNIENINSIGQLGEYYDLIVKHAKMLYNKDDTLDLVHNLFIKLDNYFKKYPEKVINGGFISNSLRNMIRNMYKVEGKYIDSNIEIEDTLDVDESYDAINKKLENEFKYELIDRKLDEINWIERLVLEYSLVMPLSEMSRLSEIPYQNLIYQLNNAKKKLGIKKIKSK